MISINGLKKIGISKSILRNKLGYNEIKKAKFFAPNNSYIEINRGENAMAVLDREKLDKFFANQASRAGSIIKQNHKVVNLVFKRNHWKFAIKYKNEDVFFKRVAP